MTFSLDLRDAAAQHSRLLIAGQPIMSIVSIVVVLTSVWLARSLLRRWDRHVEASLERHLRHARELAAGLRHEVGAVDQRASDAER